MFARSYFAGAYFAPAYFPPVVALVALERPRLGILEYLTTDRATWAAGETDIMTLIPMFLAVIDGDE